jgi:hypothetical protein
VKDRDVKIDGEKIRDEGTNAMLRGRRGGGKSAKAEMVDK